METFMTDESKAIKNIAADNRARTTELLERSRAINRSYSPPCRRRDRRTLALVSTPAVTTARPASRLAQLVVIAAAGAVGTVLRAALAPARSLPSQGSWLHLIPWPLLVINTVGVAVATYALVGPLRSRHPNDLLRLAVVTGFLGGLTSDSGLVFPLWRIAHHSPGDAAAIALLALGAGALAAYGGLLLGRRS
jgi:CrcB protein